MASKNQFFEHDSFPIFGKNGIKGKMIIESKSPETIQDEFQENMFWSFEAILKLEIKRYRLKRDMDFMMDIQLMKIKQTFE